MPSESRFRSCTALLASLATLFVGILLGQAQAADKPIRPGAPNAVSFPAQEARFVRFVIFAANSGGQPCLDELEVYAADTGTNLASATSGAKASASSCLPGYTIHRIEHLNDGQYGNGRSWIAAGTGEEWAQIELPQTAKVAKVVFSRDRQGAYSDRTPTRFEIRLSIDGEHWATVAKVESEVLLPGSTNRMPLPPALPRKDAAKPARDQQFGAFLGEEHAWLKTFGRADISSRLVPYNGRVKEYPHHVDDDRLPLPALSSDPKLDGALKDACWREASRGVVRVAFPEDFETGPLIESALSAGVRGDDLCLALETDRLLSTHVAVISSGDSYDCGVVVLTDDKLVFNTYGEDAQANSSTPIQGAFNRDLTRCELRLPLALFPGCRAQGLRVGLGMRGKHTDPTGRPVNFVFSAGRSASALAIAEQPLCRGGVFRVRVSAGAAAGVTLKGNAPGVEAGLTLAAGESRVLEIPANAGCIGPEYDLSLAEGEGTPYSLHLFRYDPLGRTISLMSDLAERLEAKGLDVGAEQAELAKLRARHDKLMAAAKRDPQAEREVFLDARLAKRRLFFREPDLAPLDAILFEKRFPFEPSHNYSDFFDAPFRPGGGVCVLRVPRVDGRFEPSKATVTQLFDAGGGIARNPMANFDLTTIYFGYRASADGYYHIMSMNPAGGSLKQLTDGPFHDFWPCPLPDGGIAFIGTRCKSRALCWRPQAATLFRMDADGGNMQPMSLANLTEWAPSVMNDGRIIWTRWEYLDKGADFGHTLWSIRPDGACPELVFGNTIIQPNGYANGREVPGTHEICCTLISHFGDLNGPIALLDLDKGRFNPKAITSITPEVPWPGMWPNEECFREPTPLARDYFLCSHAPRSVFGLYVIDRFGNRELVYEDPAISSMCPTLYRRQTPPPTLAQTAKASTDRGEFFLEDVYAGLTPAVARDSVKYLRVVREVRDDIEKLANGEYRKDYENFMEWYASPVDKVNGPFGWPTYVAKESVGIVPVEEDGSARFYAPADQVLYFQALDKDFNEIQRMRSVVQLQPGEVRSCIGCHESRQKAPPMPRRAIALTHPPREIDPPSWGTGAFSFEQVVQPVLDAKCVRCHNERDAKGLDLTATLDADKVPASYKTLITKGLVHYVDCGWNSGGCEKLAPLTFGSVKSKLWEVLNAGHHDVKLTTDEVVRIKTWIDLNCPLWPDYIERAQRPAPKLAQAK